MALVVRGSKDDSVVICISSFSGSESTSKHDILGMYPLRKRGLKIILHLMFFLIFSDSSIWTSRVDASIEEEVEVVVVVEESVVVMESMKSIFLMRVQILEW